MDITEKQIWQTIPIIGTGFTLFVIISNLISHSSGKMNPEDFISPTGVLVMLSITMIVFLYLIFFPSRIFLYPVICIMYGFLNIVDGGNIIGFMLFMLGCAFALKSGFFKRKAQLKFFYIVLSLIGALLTQIRYTVPVFVNSLLNIGILTVILLMFWFLFRSYFAELLPRRAELTNIDLGKYDLQKRDYDFIRQIMQNKKYDAIATTHRISESAVKQRAGVIYRKLGVSNRTEFLILASNAKIIFPDDESIN